MIDNLLFDLDGTLTDPKDGITRCIQFALERMKREVPPSEEILWCIGPPLRQSFSRLLGSDNSSLVEVAMEHYRERFSAIGIYENSVYPGIPQALQVIRTKGFNIFLATSKPTVFAGRILHHFGLARFFRGVYGSNLDGSLSDKAELVAHILSAEGLDPGSTLIVGDRFHDVIGGKKNGIGTAMVAYGYGSRTEIEEAEPDLVFDYPADLATWGETATGSYVPPDRLRSR